MARAYDSADWGDSYANVVVPQGQATASMQGNISLGSMYSQRNKNLLDLRREHGNPEPEYEFDVLLTIMQRTQAIPTIQSITAPDDVFSFKYEFARGGIVIPHLSDLKPISVTYWDYRQLPVTKALREMYDSQFDGSGYPKISARNQGQCRIRTDSQTYLTLGNLYISRPLKTSFTMNQQLASFKFDIVYGEYSYEDNTATVSKDTLSVADAVSKIKDIIPAK